MEACASFWSELRRDKIALVVASFWNSFWEGFDVFLGGEKRCYVLNCWTSGRWTPLLLLSLWLEKLKLALLDWFLSRSVRDGGFNGFSLAIELSRLETWLATWGLPVGL